MLVSVIIPTLNEAAYIEATLDALHRQDGPLEVIVVDGGSTDGTAALAASYVTVLHTPQSRARQMNAGAKHATGDALLFLHADTRLPPNGTALIRRTLARSGSEAGIFRLSFDRDAPLLRFYALCTHLPWVRLCFGDRGLFVRRETFEAVGGFPDWPVFEDLELAARLHQRGGFTYLSEAVTTSARRFERYGMARQQLRNLRLWLHYCLGTPPEHVAHLYAYDE